MAVGLAVSASADISVGAVMASKKRACAEIAGMARRNKCWRTVGNKNHRGESFLHTSKYYPFYLFWVVHYCVC